MSVFIVYGGYRCNGYVLQEYFQCVCSSEDKAKTITNELNEKNGDEYNEYWYSEEDVIE